MRSNRSGFLEIGVIVGVLAVLGFSVSPRDTRAASLTAAERAAERLVVLRNAIERYCFDHGAWPGQQAGGEQYPAGTAATFVAQLTQHTDGSGQVSAHGSARHCYGPYLRSGMRGESVLMIDTREATLEVDTTGVDWLFDCATGTLQAAE